MSSECCINAVGKMMLNLLKCRRKKEKQISNHDSKCSTAKLENKYGLHEINTFKQKWILIKVSGSLYTTCIFDRNLNKLRKWYKFVYWEWAIRCPGSRIRLIYLNSVEINWIGTTTDVTNFPVTFSVQECNLFNILKFS